MLRAHNKLYSSCKSVTLMDVKVKMMHSTKIQESITELEAHAIAKEAYCFLYPLMTMDVTRKQCTNVPAGSKPGFGPMNLFSHMRAYPGADPIANDLATTRGFAAPAWYRGADQIYLFNYMDSQTRPVSAKDYRVLVEEGLGKEVVTSQPRRIIQAFRDTVPPGFDAGVKLPAVIGDNTTFILNIGKKPKSGNVMFKAGLAQGEGLEDAVLGVMINGVPCEMAGENATLFPGAKRSVQFRCPLKAVKHGANTIQLLQPTGPAQKVVWAEIMIDPN